MTEIKKWWRPDWRPSSPQREHLQPEPERVYSPKSGSRAVPIIEPLPKAPTARGRVNRVSFTKHGELSIVVRLGLDESAMAQTFLPGTLLELTMVQPPPEDTEK